MKRAHLLIASSAAIAFTVAAPAGAQRTDSQVELIAGAGTPLRVALDKTIAVKRVGQVVTGTLVEPLYAYDRLVLPVGTLVVGHVASLGSPSKLNRLRAWSGGSFAPQRQVVLQFDSLTRDGIPVPFQARGLNGLSNVRRHVAAGTGSQGKIRDSIAAANQQVSDTIAAIKEPGRTERVKLMLIDQLPYDPQYLTKGTVYDAELLAPLRFGRVDPIPSAAAATAPAPSSVLRARLTTTLDSATSTRGARVEAVVTQPVLSADHRLVVPEGTRLFGEVTVARRARWFRRNGQLRFLFERVEMPQHEVPLLASLHSVDISADEHVAVDEEGGVRTTNPKTRFIAPALAAVALAGAGDGEDHPVSPKHPQGGGGNPGAMGLGGLLGFNLIAAAIAPLSQPLGLTLAIVGVARTTYTSIVGKGQDVRFAADTPIELELAPGPSAESRAKD